MGSVARVERELGRTPRGERETPRRHLVGVAGPALLERLLAAASGIERRRRPLLRWVSSISGLAKGIVAHEADAVLLEIRGPSRRGLEAVRAARLAAPELPLVVVTRDGDDDLGRAALLLGAQDYLAESDVTPRALERSLRQAGERLEMQRALQGQPAFLASLRGAKSREPVAQGIQSSADSFRCLADAAPDPIVVHRGDVILWSNKALLRLVGADSPEDAGAGSLSSWLEAEPGEPEPASDGEGDAQIRTAVVRTHRGATVPVEVRSYRILFGGGEATLSTLRDLAAREQEAHARAQHERLASLGRLAANLGHEINNPLSYVVSNLSYLGSHLSDLSARVTAAPGSDLTKSLAGELEEVLGAAADALEGAERVAAIVRDVRVLSRIESRELTSLRLPEVLEASVRIARGKLAEVAQVSLVLQDVPLVRANDTALLQVFVNLLVNAADACSEIPARQHEVGVGCFRDAEGRAVVEIRDTGPGISDDIRQHLFEPFFTTKPAGSGFGLAISFAIVESLGGTLTLEGDGPRGAVARVVLPPAARAEAALRGRRTPTSRRARPSGRAAPGPAPRARTARGSATRAE